MVSSSSSHRFTFVTIGFEGDLGLLQLQARSMRLFCPAERIEEIILVDNSSSGSEKWHGSVLRQYGELAELVRIVPASQIAAIAPETHGWFSQQILKLQVARIVRGGQYVLLDAKNHLIRRANPGYFLAADGLPRIYRHSYRDHPIRDFLERALRFFDLDAERHIDSFPRTNPPCIMLTQVVRELIQYVEQREEKPFATVFLERKLSEFFLYWAYLLFKDRLGMYSITGFGDPELWPGTCDRAGCAASLQKARETESPFMMVHREAMAKLDRESRMMVAAFWQDQGLFATVKDGVRFLEAPNGGYQTLDGEVISWPLSEIVSFIQRKAVRIPNETARQWQP